MMNHLLTISQSTTIISNYKKNVGVILSGDGGDFLVDTQDIEAKKTLQKIGYKCFN